MEGNGGSRKNVVTRASSSREPSPDRAKPAQGYVLSTRTLTATTRAVRKVQVIYYLSRNGQLEHPHFMELPHLPHQPLRLKDVMDRLTMLRGKGMPSLFSWSCKRSYKNGYVWNDLSENDVIYPSDGVEYVLKGSEILPGCPERFRHLPISNRSPTKPLPLPHKQYMEDYRDDAVEDSDDEEEAECQEYSQRGSHASSQANHKPRRAEKSGSALANRNRPIELPLDETSPPSSSSSDKPQPPPPVPLPQPSPARGGGSVFLQLIACGSAAAKPKDPAARRSGGLQRGLMSRLAARAGLEEEEDEGELSRRFGHLPVEDKEYFSGSIVEGGKAPPMASLKRSNSCNEERTSRLGIGGIGVIGEEIRMEEAGEKIPGEGVKGRCIPGRKKK